MSVAVPAICDQCGGKINSEGFYNRCVGDKILLFCSHKCSVDDAVAVEREACARIADIEHDEAADCDAVLSRVAAAIRDRGDEDKPVRSYETPAHGPGPQWQHLGNDSWVFGNTLRGLVRQRLAEVYFDEGAEGREGGWIWIILGEKGNGARGVACDLTLAVEAAEKAMGVSP